MALRDSTVLAKNRESYFFRFQDDEQGLDWAGCGWIIEREEVEILAVTSDNEPFVTVKMDLYIADAAKKTYPRYVREKT